jgi:hypothetical protein
MSHHCLARRSLSQPWQIRYHNVCHQRKELAQGYSHWRGLWWLRWLSSPANRLWLWQQLRGRSFKLCIRPAYRLRLSFPGCPHVYCFSSLVFDRFLRQPEGTRDSDHFRHSDQHTAAICRCTHRRGTSAHRLLLWLFQLREQQHLVWHILSRGWRSHLYRI